mgnify:CR=1 FL=1
MFSCVSFTFLEFREVLNYALHIFDRVELRVALLFLQEALNEVVDGVRNIPEIRKHYLPEKFIFVAGKNNFFHLIWQMSKML